jgi:regulatory protein
MRGDASARPAVGARPLDPDARLQPPLESDARLQPPLESDARLQPPFESDARLQPPLEPDVRLERPLEPEARLQRALDLGYRHLGKRDRTAAEVRRHLEARDVDEASIDGAIEALVRQGYVDDARYARAFAEDRRALDDWGPERIERRLLELGVEPGHVAQALANRAVGDELEAAVALLRRRWRVPPDTDRERERALRVLVRKGYDLDLAYDAVRAFARADA